MLAFVYGSVTVNPTLRGAAMSRTLQEGPLCNQSVFDVEELER